MASFPLPCMGVGHHASKLHSVMSSDVDMCPWSRIAEERAGFSQNCLGHWAEPAAIPEGVAQEDDIVVEPGVGAQLQPDQWNG